MADIKRINTIQLIEDYNKGISEAQRNEKFKKMSRSQFDFLRGTNFLFWQTLQHDQRLLSFSNPKAYTWVQGDTHPQNIALSPDNKGELVYSFNDFDESFEGNPLFDVLRMSVAIMVAAHQQKLRGYEAVEHFCEYYTQALATRDQLNSFVCNMDNAVEPLKSFMAECSEKETRQKFLKKWTDNSDSGLRFDKDKHEDLVAMSDSEKQALLKHFEVYVSQLVAKGYNKHFFDTLDVAHRVGAGIGALGKPRYYMLIAGNNDNDARILDIKMQSPPVSFDFAEGTQNNYNNHALRNIQAAGILSNHDNSLNGWFQAPQGVFSVHERLYCREYFPLDNINADLLLKLAENWAYITASGHWRGANEAWKQHTNKFVRRADEFIGVIAEMASEMEQHNAADFSNFLDAFKLQ